MTVKELLIIKTISKVVLQNDTHFLRIISIFKQIHQLSINAQKFKKKTIKAVVLKCTPPRSN